MGTFCRLETPRDAYRVALRQTRFFKPTRPSSDRGATPLLVHYHIYKNAGTSFEWALKKAFGDGFRMHDSPSAGGIVSARELKQLANREPQLRAISSHGAMPPAPRILGRTVISSMLIRDPIARIGSIYSFERKQQVETPGAIKAKELGFKEYVEWRLRTSAGLFCNYQVYVCAGKTRYSPLCRLRDLEAAVIRLDGIDLVGTVRRYQDWLALVQAALEQAGLNVTLEAGHQNRSEGKTTLSEAAILAHLMDDLGSGLTNELIERNELDMCLHQVADSLLTRRLAERAVRITLREAYTQTNSGLASA
ncbi:MAG: hypothetical protein ACR2G0_08875 [Chthoniobacterales bacterium]